MSLKKMQNFLMTVLFYKIADLKYTYELPY